MIIAAMLEGQEYSDFPARVASQLDSKMLLHQLADIVAARPVDELQISESRPPGHIPFGVLPYLERYTDKDNLGKDLLSLGGKIGDLGGSLMDKTGVARLSRMTGIDALAEKAKEAAKAGLDATKAGLKAGAALSGLAQDDEAPLSHLVIPRSALLPPTADISLIHQPTHPPTNPRFVCLSVCCRSDLRK